MLSSILIGAKRAEWLLLLAWITCSGSRAQDTQFLPEVDAHLALNSSMRVYLQAKDDREGGDPQQFTFGPSVQFYRKPLMQLGNAAVFDLDNVKSRLLVLESGYRVITAPDTPPKNRAIENVTFRFPLQWRTLLADKNRADLDWQNGALSLRPGRLLSRFIVDRTAEEAEGKFGSRIASRRVGFWMITHGSDPITTNTAIPLLGNRIFPTSFLNRSSHPIAESEQCRSRLARHGCRFQLRSGNREWQSGECGLCLLRDDHNRAYF